MKVKGKEEDLTSSQLSWLCIQPMLLAVRGKDITAKKEMYQQLNEGQKGLYLFYSFHNHAKSIEEFYWFSGHYILDIHSWGGIKSGVQFFQDLEMVDLLDQIEVLILKQSKVEGQSLSLKDLESDHELSNKISEYFNHYQELSKNTINRMNTWILNNKEDFLEGI